MVPVELVDLAVSAGWERHSAGRVIVVPVAPVAPGKKIAGPAISPVEYGHGFGQLNVAGVGLWYSATFVGKKYLAAADLFDAAPENSVILLNLDHVKIGSPVIFPARQASRVIDQAHVTVYLVDQRGPSDLFDVQ